MSDTLAARTLKVALGDYPGLSELKSRQSVIDGWRLDFEEVPVVTRVFAPMVRELRYDLCELAIGTFLQAKAHGKRIMLLPVVLAARFQDAALVCLANSDLKSPADLAGRRVGVRSYSQTTGMWVRGMMEEQFGLRADQVRWVTLESPHVIEAVDPAWTERAPAGTDLMALLRVGEIDAVIAGEMPKAPDLRTVIADPVAAGEAFYQRHGFIPINHMLTIREELVDRSPELATGIVQLFRDLKSKHPATTDGRDVLPLGHDAVQDGVALALRFAMSQGLLPGPLTIDEVWA